MNTFHDKYALYWTEEKQNVMKTSDEIRWYHFNLLARITMKQS